MNYCGEWLPSYCIVLNSRKSKEIGVYSNYIE